MKWFLLTPTYLAHAKIFKVDIKWVGSSWLMHIRISYAQNFHTKYVVKFGLGSSPLLLSWHATIDFLLKSSCHTHKLRCLSKQCKVASINHAMPSLPWGDIILLALSSCFSCIRFVYDQIPWEHTQLGGNLAGLRLACGSTLPLGYATHFIFSLF